MFHPALAQNPNAKLLFLVISAMPCDCLPSCVGSHARGAVVGLSLTLIYKTGQILTRKNLVHAGQNLSDDFFSFLPKSRKALNSLTFVCPSKLCCVHFTVETMSLSRETPNLSAASSRTSLMLVIFWCL
jgi:hypothetical protein